MAKLGGVIGAVIAITLVFYVGDHFDWTRDKSDYVGSAVAVAGGIVGWWAGSRVVRRLTAHRPQRTH
jgi:uncharacterized membrane protein YfcA